MSIENITVKTRNGYLLPIKFSLMKWSTFTCIIFIPIILYGVDLSLMSGIDPFTVLCRVELKAFTFLNYS